MQCNTPFYYGSRLIASDLYGISGNVSLCGIAEVHGSPGNVLSWPGSTRCRHGNNGVLMERRTASHPRNRTFPPKASAGQSPPENAATPQLSSRNMEYGVADDFVLRNGGEAPARCGYVADGFAAPTALILMGNRRPLRMLRQISRGVCMPQSVAPRIARTSGWSIMNSRSR